MSVTLDGDHATVPHQGSTTTLPYAPSSRGSTPCEIDLFVDGPGAEEDYPMDVPNTDTADRWRLELTAVRRRDGASCQLIACEEPWFKLHNGYDHEAGDYEAEIESSSDDFGLPLRYHGPEMFDVDIDVLASSSSDWTDALERWVARLRFEGQRVPELCVNDGNDSMRLAVRFNQLVLEFVASGEECLNGVLGTPAQVHYLLEHGLIWRDPRDPEPKPCIRVPSGVEQRLRDRRQQNLPPPGLIWVNN